MITNRIKNIYQRYIWWSDNEKHIAKRLLEAVTRKLWITFEDLISAIEIDSTIKQVTIPVDKKYITLLIQVVYKVTNKRNIYLDKEETRVVVSTNQKNEDEIKKLFEIYKRHYDNELSKLEEEYKHKQDIMLQSFLHKHKIYWTQVDNKEDYTEEELRRLQEIQRMISELDDIDIEEKILG